MQYTEIHQLLYKREQFVGFARGSGAKMGNFSFSVTYMESKSSTQSTVDCDSQLWSCGTFTNTFAASSSLYYITFISQLCSSIANV